MSQAESLPPEGSLAFTYHPNFGDNFHAVMLGLWGSGAKAMKSVIASLVIGGFAALALSGTALPLHWIAAIAVGCALAWGAIFTVVFGAWLAGSITRRQRAIGSARIVVTEAGVARTSGEASLSHEWDGIVRVAETQRAFFLYDQENPVFAIEKSAVRSGEELAALRAFLRARKPGNYHDPGQASPC